MYLLYSYTYRITNDILTLTAVILTVLLCDSGATSQFLTISFVFFKIEIYYLQKLTCKEVIVNL